VFALIGIVVVFGAIVAGYLLERGNLLVPLQPAELVIIAGGGARNAPDREPAVHPNENPRWGVRLL
jgi:flagellar motor component MotA